MSGRDEEKVKIIEAVPDPPYAQSPVALPPTLNASAMIRVKQLGLEFIVPARWVVINFNPDRVNTLVGQLKTLLDALGLQPQQSKAAKDMVAQVVWRWIHYEEGLQHELADEREQKAMPHEMVAAF